MSTSQKFSEVQARYLASPLETRRQIEQDLVRKATSDERFRRDLLSNPRGTIEREIGYRFRRDLRIHVLEESANTLFIVLPHVPRQVNAPPGFRAISPDRMRASVCGPDDTLLIPIDGIYMIAYEHRDFGGHACVFYQSTYRANRGEFYDMGNDMISSVKVGPHAAVMLCESEGDDGQGAGVTRVYAPGQEVPYVGDDFNDKCSFIQVVAFPPTRSESLPPWATPLKDRTEQTLKA